jgi:serine/threonine-protein kinase
VHRDVRPDAVILDTGGTAILRDAGIPAPPLHHGWRAGTPQYMAPELWAGQTHTIATDLYAATGVVVDALTGHPPYRGTDLTWLGVQHAQGALPSEAVPMMARALVISGLAKDPHDRPASAALFRRDVDTAGTTFLGPGWRDRGRAWLADAVADRIADPVPSGLPVEEFEEFDDDEDDGSPLAGISFDTASDERPPGGVGWKVWAVAAAAVLVLAIVTFATVNALGGPPVQESPSAPAAPLFTPSTAPSDIVVPTSTDTASAATPTPSAKPSPTAVPTIPPNTAPVSLAATPTPTSTPIPTPSPSPT